VKAHRIRFRVLYGDTDRMGVVYYANYFRYFEAGRNEFLREAGIEYTGIEEAGYMLPVADAHARYKAPAQYDDELELETYVPQVGISSLRMAYRLRRVCDGTLLATGETRHACVRRDGSVCRLPDAFRKKLKPDGHDA